MTIFIYAGVFTFLLFALLIVYLVIKSHMRKPEVADKLIVGAKGKALTDILSDSGQVFVNGTIWEATCKDEPIKKGEKITVTAIDGLDLIVEKRIG